MELILFIYWVINHTKIPTFHEATFIISVFSKNLTFFKLKTRFHNTS